MRYLALIFVVVAACSAPSATNTTADSTTTGSTASATTTTSESQTTTARPTTTASTTTTTAAPQAQADPITYSGSSSDVVEFDQATLEIIANGAVFTFQVAGDGNNIIYGLDESFEQTKLLVNAIGNESGQRFINVFDAGPVGLEIDVGGSWDITISPFARILPPSTLEDFYVPMVDTTGTYDPASVRSIAITGPAALLLKTEDRTADITAVGDGNLVTYALSAATDEVDLLVNEIGSFEGTVLLPDCSMTCFLDISEGEYTFSIP
ncbi:MAG: hypothetical protein Q8Q52_04025 [Acidimicrobiia bacterium]|nr:hypothetical protein [Acidimicrobiia bacterium]